jgi:hypothetical protein
LSEACDSWWESTIVEVSVKLIIDVVITDHQSEFTSIAEIEAVLSTGDTFVDVAARNFGKLFTEPICVIVDVIGKEVSPAVVDEPTKLKLEHEPGHWVPQFLGRSRRSRWDKGICG